MKSYWLEVKFLFQLDDEEYIEQFNSQGDQFLSFVMKGKVFISDGENVFKTLGFRDVFHPYYDPE